MMPCKSTESTAQEEQRSQMPGVFLERTIQNLAELIFNLGEVGTSDREDHKTRKAVVPAMMKGPTIHHGISRNVRHISVIACVPVAGESLPPYIVTP
jgi:hypothetical protein